MSDVVAFEKHGRIGLITVNNPPVNALGVDVRQGLIESLNTGFNDDGVDAMVIIGGGRTFIAGADIREFGKPPKAPDFPAVLDTLENAGKPLVAAIHGTALGGGLEVCLTCHYRVALSSARVGLPEVNLGILPGAGGTQRLPRLVGPEAALDMIVTGTPVAAPKAQAMGIVDAVFDDDLAANAVAYAEQVVADNKPLRRVSQLNDKVQGVDSAVFDDYRKKIERRAHGFFAPWRCIDAVEAACTLPFEDGLKRERELFLQCMESPQRAAQMHVFFAEREVAKIPDIPKETQTRNIAKVGIVGGGTMGGGIAMNFANAGIPVTLLEISQENLDRGLEIIRGNYAATVSKGRLAQDAMDKRMGLIAGSLSYDDLADADLVIEAVFEEMDLKKQVFTKLDAVCKPGAILATNTSTLDIDEIASATKRPEAVIGTHFFSPANVMRLLENVRGKASAPETIATVMKMGKQIRKVAVLAGNCDGFIGNRMLAPYMREASFLVDEGALPQDVDRVLTEFGMPMGPFTMGDMAGLDIGWRIRKAKAASRPNDQRYSTLGDKICEMGRFGQKTGAGYYKYEPGNRKPIPDPEIEKLIVETSAEQGIERRTISDEEILTRCFYSLVNEAAKILDEGIALRSSDIDIVWIYGYGFPVYRGGPMFWADSIGLDKIYEKVCEYRESQGQFWEPSPLLERLAKDGKGFGDI